jgi:sulfopyruvate decarboxylase TPP-binding subunit
MGRAVPAVLGAMGVSVEIVSEAAEAAPKVAAALRQAFDTDAAIAVLISQHVIGIKSFEEQANQ